jgi:nitrate/TMAO reductase-like tetraheme cytochrome c subunit
MKIKRKHLAIGIGFLVLVALPFPVVSKLEEHDPFCTSCHTVPEETYFNRAQAVASGESDVPPDLASAHYGLGETEFRCIDCHRGDHSASHRFRTLLLGGRDALIWIAGRADPAIQKVDAGEPDLLIAGCLHCHAETLLELGFNNHYHNQLIAARDLVEAGLEPFPPPEGLPGTLFAEVAELDSTTTCLDCHQAHREIPDGDRTLYLDLDGVMYPACAQCHVEVGHGPEELP